MNTLNYAKLLEGKVAVITSGAHGMGREIARLFVRHGATCIINGRAESGVETAKELQLISPNSKFIRCDMSSKDDTNKFIKETLAHTGHVDIVVNNVGINKNSHMAMIKDEDFEYTQQVNLHGVIRMARGFLPSMMKTGGSFVHISTIHSVAGIATFSSYASSKSAINAFSGALAVEYGKYGIRSNIVAPGGVMTSGAETKFFENVNDDETMLKWAWGGERAQPDYGAGSAKDMANASLFLASDMAKHITGTLIMQDGGAHFQSHAFMNRRFPENSDELWLEFMRNRY